MFDTLAAARERGATPGALGAEHGVAKNLVNHHLRPLVAAGLLTSERTGREVIYRVRADAVAETGEALLRCVDRSDGAGEDLAAADAHPSSSEGSRA